ncbi:MAG: hypothetical protein JO117_00795 [Verrucomicrobia bacterium]|nr:hypothetical protein [Verrucomicrobiota bacterium]
MPGSALTFDQILSRLHLHAVLPALETLVKFCPEAQHIAGDADFSLRMSVLRGSATTLVCRAGTLTAHCGPSQPRAEIALCFLTARSLNRLFNNQSALPPLPLGWPWHLGKLRKFLALTRLLDAHLQPSPEKLATDSEFRRLHLRLLLQVLAAAAPVVGQHDAIARAALAEVSPGILEFRAPTFDFVATLGSENKPSINSTTGSTATISFRDDDTLAAALHGELDAQAAIGLGCLEVCGLIPLADAWGVALDRVEAYLQPAPAVATAA